MHKKSILAISITLLRKEIKLTQNNKFKKIPINLFN